MRTKSYGAALATVFALGTVIIPSTVWAEQLAQTETILVLDLRAISLPAADVKALDAYLVETLQRSTGHQVITTDEIDEVAALQKGLNVMGCIDEACVAKLSELASARLVLSGSVGSLGGDFILSVSLSDTEKSMVVGHASRTAPALEALTQEMDGLVREILGGYAGESAQRYSLPEGETVSFAIFDLKSLGLSDKITATLSQVLAAEVKGIGGTSVISRDDIAAMLQLESQRSALDCSDSECLAEIGGALGVDQLIVGHVGFMVDRYVISLRVIDAKSPKALSRVTEMFSGQESQLVSALRHTVRRLLGVSVEEPGHLHVSASAPQADIEVDDLVVGQTPHPPIENLSPGKHMLRVLKPGYIDWRSHVYIDPGGLQRIYADLEETPTRWIFWGFVAGTAAMATGVGISGGLSAYYDNEFTRLTAVGGSGAERFAAQNAAVNASTMTNVFIGLGSTLAVGTVVAFFLTDWD